MNHEERGRDRRLRIFLQRCEYQAEMLENLGGSIKMLLEALRDLEISGRYDHSEGLLQETRREIAPLIEGLAAMNAENGGGDDLSRFEDALEAVARYMELCREMRLDWAREHPLLWLAGEALETRFARLIEQEQTERRREPEGRAYIRDLHRRAGLETIPLHVDGWSS